MYHLMNFSICYVDCDVLVPYGLSQNDTDVLDIFPSTHTHSLDDVNYFLEFSEEVMFGDTLYTHVWVSFAPLRNNTIST